MACRISRTSEWSLRLYHEMNYHKENCWLTLTYDDENLPRNGSLSKREAQLFIKRLRKWLEPERIKHYLCGEYGDKLGRPHYHVIIFGWKPEDDDLVRYRKNKYYSKKVLDLWPFGFNDYGYVTYDSIRYTAEYCQKKLNGKQSYMYLGVEPPFMICSQGLGLRYAQDYGTDVMTVKGKKNPIPRYYKKKLDIKQETDWRERWCDRMEQRAQELRQEPDIHIAKCRSQANKNLIARSNLSKRSL